MADVVDRNNIGKFSENVSSDMRRRLTALRDTGRLELAEIMELVFTIGKILGAIEGEVIGHDRRITVNDIEKVTSGGSSEYSRYVSELEGIFKRAFNATVNERGEGEERAR